MGRRAADVIMGCGSSSPSGHELAAEATAALGLPKGAKLLDKLAGALDAEYKQEQDGAVGQWLDDSLPAFKRELEEEYNSSVDAFREWVEEIVEKAIREKVTSVHNLKLIWKVGEFKVAVAQPIPQQPTAVAQPVSYAQPYAQQTVQYTQQTTVQYAQPPPAQPVYAPQAVAYAPQPQAIAYAPQPQAVAYAPQPQAVAQPVYAQPQAVAQPVYAQSIV